VVLARASRRTSLAGVELELDPPDVEVLEGLAVLELLLALVLFVDVVCCPDWVLTPPVPRVAARGGFRLLPRRRATGCTQPVVRAGTRRRPPK
jgi:hypothetical protein